MELSLYQELKRLYRVRAYGTDEISADAELPAYFLAHNALRIASALVGVARRADVQARLGLPPAAPSRRTTTHRLPDAPALASSTSPSPCRTTHRHCCAPRDRFVRTAYPRRLLRVRITPELEEAYRHYVAGVCRTPEAYTRLTDRRCRTRHQVSWAAPTGV